MDCIREFEMLYPETDMQPNMIIYCPKLWGSYESWLSDTAEIDFRAICHQKGYAVNPVDWFKPAGFDFQRMVQLQAFIAATNLTTVEVESGTIGKGWPKLHHPVRRCEYLFQADSLAWGAYEAFRHYCTRDDEDALRRLLRKEGLSRARTHLAYDQGCDLQELYLLSLWATAIFRDHNEPKGA